MRKFGVLILLCVLGLLALPSAEAASIYLRYFESAETDLSEAQFQLFSFSALRGEKITIVAYGLQEEIIPSLSVLDTEGKTLQEDLNPNLLPVAAVQLNAPANGTYPFVVSRLSEQGGMVRVMIFEGDPLAGDLSLLDTIDPYLPSRGYLVAGSDSNPITMSVSVVDDQDANTPAPQVYASRGTQLAPPPIEERTHQIQQFTWENTQGDIFYTLNVSTYPDPLPTSQKLRAFLSYPAQIVGLFTIEIQINDGSAQADYLPRFQCGAYTNRGTPLRNGPAVLYSSSNNLPANTPVEVIGANGGYLQVVDTTNSVGASWVWGGNISGIPADQCVRVEAVKEPALTEQNIAPEYHEQFVAGELQVSEFIGGGQPTMLGDVILDETELELEPEYEGEFIEGEDTGGDDSGDDGGDDSGDDGGDIGGDDGGDDGSDTGGDIGGDDGGDIGGDDGSDIGGGADGESGTYDGGDQGGGDIGGDDGGDIGGDDGSDTGGDIGGSDSGGDIGGGDIGGGDDSGGGDSGGGDSGGGGDDGGGSSDA